MQSESQMSAQVANKKATDKALAKLRSRLDAGDMDAVEGILSEASISDLLTRVREQKLLLRPPIEHRSAFVGLLRVAGGRLEAKERTEFENYLEFATEVDAAKQRYIERLHASLRLMPACSKADLLAIASEVFEWCIREQVKRFDLNSVDISIAENERRLHDLNGAANDITMAVARLINEYCRIATVPNVGRLSQAELRQAAEIVIPAITVAGEVNSLEFFFDSVTYGEFTVDKVDEGEQSTYRFHFVDAKRYLLKSLAIRRSLVLKYAGQPSPRYVRETLRGLEDGLLEQAVDYYVRRAGTSSEEIGIDRTRASRTSAALMLAVDAEDDLLVAASHSDGRTLSHYLVAMAMRWYSVAANAVRDAPNIRRRRWLDTPPIPLDEIASNIGGIDEKTVAEAIENLTLELPARSHFNLTDLPFIREGRRIARPFLHGQVGTWTCVVREILIQGGAIGKDVGAIWEDFYVQSFEDSDWRVIGRGIKLRNNGRTLTDVDILLLREDLLLVMQVKALIGAADGPYDHWRNRKTVEYGCTQARIATSHFEANPQALEAICGKKLAARIKHVQPVVLTNIDQLDGWRVDNVPVIGEVTRKAICRGAKVDYRNSQTGEVIHTHHFVKQEDLSTASILQLFEEPIEMRIAAEGTETVHSTHHIGGLKLLMPEFAIRTDANQPPVHEPNSSARMQAGEQERFSGA